MNKIKHILAFLLFISMMNSNHAQQDPMYSLYMFDKMIINPAFTGSSDWMVGTIKHRSQFVGMAGNPTTQTLNFHTPITKRHVGLGVKIINDKIAIMSNLNASLVYSYHLNVAGGKMSVGLETGFYSRKTAYNELTLSTLNDNAIPMEGVRSMVPDVGWGMYYQKKQFYIGLSQSHLLKMKFKDNLENSDSRLASHLYLLAGTVFDFSKKISLEPSFLLKHQGASPVQLDLNAMLYYNDKIGFGLQYRTGDAFVLMAKITVTDGLRIGYAFDTTLSGLSTYSGGAHELVVSYGIKLPPPPTEKEIHPRYYF